MAHMRLPRHGKLAIRLPRFAAHSPDARFLDQTLRAPGARPQRLIPNGCRHRRVARQGQDDQQVSRQEFRGLRLLRPHPRPAVEGRVGRSRRRFRDDLGRRHQVGAADERDRQGGEGRRSRHPRDRPGSRGRGDLLARARGLESQEGAQGRHGLARHLQRDHQVGRLRGDGAAARDRRRAGRRLSGAPRTRLPRRLHALPGAVAQAAWRALCRPRAIGDAAHHLRPRTRDRKVRPPGILVARRIAEDQGPGELPRAPRRRRRREARPARHQDRGGGQGIPGRARGWQLRRHQGRGEAGAAQSIPAVHDLDDAAGGLAQARLHAEPHDAARPAPLRGHRDRRRDDRPHHLHAHRRRRHGAGGRAWRAPRDQPALRRPLRAEAAAPVHDQGEERAGGARGDPPDRARAPAEAGGARARSRDAEALRAHLDAHRREPDGIGRPRAHRGRHRRRGQR